MKLLKNISMHKILLFIFTVKLGLVSSGCFSFTPIYYDDDKKAAQEKVEKFHQLYNDKKFQEMYEMMSPETKKVLGQDQFVQRFENLYSELGKKIKSKVIKEDIKPQASFRLVNSIYETEFEKGKVKENFVCSTNNEGTFIEIYDQPDKDNLESPK